MPTATMSSRTKGLDPVYSSEKTAERLGISLASLKRHKYQGQKIFAPFGKLVGKSVVYTDDDIAKMRIALDQLAGPGRSNLNRKQVIERQTKALAMFEKKKSLQEIATALKFTDTSGAYRAIQAAKKRRGK